MGPINKKEISDVDPLGPEKVKFKSQPQHNPQLFSRFGRKRISIEHKLSLLGLIADMKHVLFGQFSTENKKLKHEAWEEVRVKAILLGICEASRDRDFVRDKVYGEWKRVSLRNRTKIKGRKTGKIWEPNVVDEAIYSIIDGDDPTSSSSPAKHLQPIPPSPTPMPSVDSEIPLLLSEDEVEEDYSDKSEHFPLNERVAQTVLLNTKHQKQIELLDVEIYKRKLECAKLEKDLGLQASEFTQGLSL